MKFLIIAKREYLKVVRSKAFWISVLLFPMFIAIVLFISKYSSEKLDEKMKSAQVTINDASKDNIRILVFDELGYVKDKEDKFKSSGIAFVNDEQEGIGKVKNGSVEVFIHYPQDLLEKNTIKIYSIESDNLAESDNYNSLAESILKQSILLDINDANKIQILSTTYGFDVKTFKNGEPALSDFEKFFFPIVFIIMYILFTSISSGYLLLSMAEEKENRTMEAMLSMVKPKELILGKIIGQIGVVFTQFIVMFSLAIFSVFALKVDLPFNLLDIHISWVQLFFSVYYLIGGILFMMISMIGVGSSMPNQKESQSFSSIFILLSILPIYFFTLIIAEPNGKMATITSYIPFMSPLVLLLRNTLGALTTTDKIISLVVIPFYVYIAFLISYKIFEIGALEYNQKISLKSLIGIIKKM